MRAAATVLAAAVLLAGCGRATIKRDGAERSVANVVAQQTGFHPRGVKCPYRRRSGVRRFDDDRG